MEENSGFLFALWQKFVRGGVTSSFLYPCWKLQCRRWWMSLSHWGVFMSAHGRLLNRYCFLGTLDSHSWALSAGSEAFEVSNLRLGVLGRVWIPLFLWLLNRLLCHDGFSAPQLALPQFSPPSHLVLDPHDSCGCQGKIPEARRESWPEPPAADTVWGWLQPDKADKLGVWVRQWLQCCIAVGVFSWSLYHGDVAVPLHTSGFCRSCVGAAGGAF